MARLLLTTTDYSRLRKSALRAQLYGQATMPLVTALLDSVNAATVIEPSDMPPDVVTMNSVVRIRYVHENRRQDIRLVYPEVADVRQHFISILTPMALSLLGRKVGDTLFLDAYPCTVPICIEQIVYQPETAESYCL
ncbi:regulator of nucleoside diphosphate kinase [Catalinimonas alkaloidigena]|uniref:Regulator of nucleoside diphosphate kinase n=1 Tax=Catalinimonas alkaloidigena TaxID=1075417 RepID=A0A1G9TJH9_9BACT|nr:GreA/GreB family elongation factor [Catalinimonas alkaloidigena]SDM47906.1 regulator of nucleoside diphosphate kinase [Catalinimonas alkaloidigena]